MGERIEYIDIIKAFAIYCVVWGHSIQYLSNNDFFSNPVFEFIYSFHMPLFMILSGWFSGLSLKLSFTKLVIKKFKQLILPVITWTIFICLFNNTILFSSEQIISHLKFVILSFANVASNLFWFLQCLFFCYIFSYIGLKYIRNEFLASFILIIIFLFILREPIYAFRFLLPYFLGGVILRKYSYLIDRYSIELQITTVVLFVIMLFFWNGKYTIYVSPIPKILNFTNYSINFGNWRITIFRYLIGTVGSLFVIISIKNISNKNFNGKKYLLIVGGYTMEIYILQSLILEHNLFLRNLFQINNIWIYSFLITPLISIVVISICCIMIKFVEKSKIWNSILFGKINHLTLVR